MPPSTSASVDTETSWRRQMREAFRCVDKLCEYLDVDVKDAFSAEAASSFPLFAPRPYVSRIRRGDSSDPLLQQILPHVNEMVEIDGYGVDPLNEANVSTQPGLLQKYTGRVLLVTTGACAIHCRYCFRRHFPYDVVPHSPDAWEPAIDAIRQDPSIEEVILSGGDPLTLVDKSIEWLVRQIEPIDHVARIRFHTRLPIMIPDRVTNDFVELLASTRLQPLVVLHANHAAEIDGDVVSACQRLRRVGVPLLNQSVLLRGVNDSAELMENLCRRLINIGVIPYYMHQLDQVAGAAHFHVSKQTGLEIIDKLQSRLPGYAVPRYVEEIAGDTSKRFVTD